MKRHLILLLTGASILLLAAACTSEPDDLRAEDLQRVAISLNIGVPAREAYTTRALPGDPGTFELMEHPEWGYVYFVPTDGPKEGQVFPPARLVDENLETLDNPIPMTSWTETENPEDFPQTYADRIYRYNGFLYFEVPAGTSKGKLYVVATKEKLPNLSAVIYKDEHFLETELLNTSFDIKDNEGHTIRDHLQCIYSTPYNYLNDEGVYYGTISDLNSEAASYVNLMLYHIAAKVDVNWNVVSDQQETFWISFIEARKLCEEGCLLFRPTENVCTKVKEWTDGIFVPDQAKTYDCTLMGWNGKSPSTGSFSADRGRQWYGRQYFYAIPFLTQEYPPENPNYTPPKYFDLQLRMLKDDGTEMNANDGYNLLLRKDMSAESDVFVPWLRFDLRFTHTMEYRKETRIIE